MIGVSTVAAAFGVAAFFFLTLICFSLRDFSRSRLEEICKQHRRVSRFGLILQHHEKMLLLSESALLLLVMVLTWRASQSPYFEIFVVPSQLTLSVAGWWCVRIVAGTTLLILFAVFLPWTLARVRGEVVLYRAWPIFALLAGLTAPVWQFVLQLDRMVHRIFGVPEPDSEEVAGLLTEELLSVVDESRREGVIQMKASTMIHRVVDLQTEDVAAIMTPRTDMVTIFAGMPLNDALHEMLQTGFSRVPVIRDGIDDIVGILYARDLLTYLAQSNESSDLQTVKDIARDVLYAPESQGIADLLEAMRQQKVHMAIVVDEYSGVSGLVTLEDILEEIVGEISDEYDSEDHTLWKEHRDGCTEVDARYHLDDLNEEFSYGLPEDEEFDTVGGFVLSCFGRIPKVGEEHYWKNLKLTVLDADERRLIRVRIELENSGSTAPEPHSASA